MAHKKTDLATTVFSYQPIPGSLHMSHVPLMPAPTSDAKTSLQPLLLESMRLLGLLTPLMLGYVSEPKKKLE